MQLNLRSGLEPTVRNINAIHDQPGQHHEQVACPVEDSESHEEH